MDENDTKKKIRGGEHLTWVDTLRAQVKPLVGRDEVTGRVTYPREQYLTDVAEERRRSKLKGPN